MNVFHLDKTKRCAHVRHISPLTKRQTDRQLASRQENDEIVYTWLNQGCMAECKWCRVWISKKHLHSGKHLLKRPIDQLLHNKIILFTFVFVFIIGMCNYYCIWVWMCKGGCRCICYWSRALVCGQVCA